jgi:hypothetical protein
MSNGASARFFASHCPPGGGGTVLRLAALGNVLPDGRRCDLYLMVQIQEM